MTWLRVIGFCSNAASRKAYIPTRHRRRAVSSRPSTPYDRVRTWKLESISVVKWSKMPLGEHREPPNEFL